MENNELKYYMSKGWVRGLFIYYLLLIIIGIAFMLKAFLSLNESENDYVISTFLVSILSSMTFSSIYYSKKMYKACIDGRLLFENDNKAILLGNSMYFFLRPIFSVAFSVMFVICILGGAFFLMNGLDYVINDRMVYLSAIVSSAIGYSIGNVLDKFGTLSKKTTDKM